MRNLIEMPLQGVQKTLDVTIFYYGAAPDKLQILPAEAEFIIVYSPRNNEDWQSVRYKVIAPQRGYSVMERRSLEAEEITHFEQLLKRS